MDIVTAAPRHVKPVTSEARTMICVEEMKVELGKCIEMAQYYHESQNLKVYERKCYENCSPLQKTLENYKLC